MSEVSYRALGVRPVVNAAAAQSHLGGSLMSPGVLAAIADANSSFVDVAELHDRVGERLADLTGNQAACVTCGAAAAIVVATAACLVGSDSQAARELPRVPETRSVAVWRPHSAGRLAGTDDVESNGYLAGVAMAGALVKLIDDVNDLDAADACLLWFPAMFADPREDEMFDVLLGRARELDVPVVVDAADGVPPFSNLSYYTVDRGADLALFSGGKGLQGPQSSGLILGRSDLVEACRINSGPAHSVGRPSKVTKEALIGLLAAVEEAAQDDPAVAAARWTSTVDTWIQQLAVVGELGVGLRRTAVSHSGQPIPRVIVELPDGLAARRDHIMAMLWERTPRVAVLPEACGIALNPHMVRPDEVDLVTVAVVSALRDVSVELTSGVARRVPPASQFGGTVLIDPTSSSQSGVPL